MTGRVSSQYNMHESSAPTSHASHEPALPPQPEYTENKYPENPLRKSSQSTSAWLKDNQLKWAAHQQSTAKKVKPLEDPSRRKSLANIPVPRQQSKNPRPATNANPANPPNVQPFEKNLEILNGGILTILVSTIARMGIKSAIDPIIKATSITAADAEVIAETSASTLTATLIMIANFYGALEITSPETRRFSLIGAGFAVAGMSFLGAATLGTAVLSLTGAIIAASRFKEISPASPGFLTRSAAATAIMGAAAWANGASVTAAASVGAFFTGAAAARKRFFA